MADDKRRALALLRQGRSRLQVCQLLGVDPGQLSRWVLEDRRTEAPEMVSPAPYTYDPANMVVTVRADRHLYIYARGVPPLIIRE
jgi:transposase-like protein